MLWSCARAYHEGHDDRGSYLPHRLGKRGNKEEAGVLMALKVHTASDVASSRHHLNTAEPQVGKRSVPYGSLGGTCF